MCRTRGAPRLILVPKISMARGSRTCGRLIGAYTGCGRRPVSTNYERESSMTPGLRLRVTRALFDST